jgi:LPS export ABC transporter protein LptC
MKKIFIVLGFIGLFVGCSSGEKALVDGSLVGQHVIEKFTVTQTEGGKLKMILESESAIIDEQSNITKIEHPTMKFYRDGQYASTLIMESAQIDLETYDVKGHGNCVIDTFENEHLQTTDLEYDSKNKKVFSKNEVTIERSGETLYGTAFEADTNLDNVVIENQKIVINKGSK